MTLSLGLMQSTGTVTVLQILFYSAASTSLYCCGSYGPKPQWINQVGYPKVKEFTQLHESTNRLFLVLNEVNCLTLVNQLLEAPTPYRHDNTRLGTHMPAPCYLSPIWAARSSTCVVCYTQRKPGWHPKSWVDTGGFTRFLLVCEYN